MRHRNPLLSVAALLVGICTQLVATPAYGQPVVGASGERPVDTASLLVSGGGNLPPPAPDGSSLQQDFHTQLMAPPSHAIHMEPETCCGWGSVFVDAEYLLIQPRRRMLDYVIVSGTNDGIAQGPVDTLALQTTSGTRVGGGYQTPDSMWQFGGYYTYLHSIDNGSAITPPNGALYATLTHPGFVSLVSTASANTNVNYQVFDLEFARRIPMGDTGTVRLIGGTRFAWIDQNLNAFYNGISANQAAVSSPETFFGAGLRMGADGQWAVFRGLGFYARASGSLMSGNFTTSLRETNNAGGTVLANITENYNKIVPVAELGLGVSWQRGNFRARAGYEMMNWFGLVDTPDFVHDFSNKLEHRYSDLGLQGLVLQFQWAY